MYTWGKITFLREKSFFNPQNIVKLWNKFLKGLLDDKLTFVLSSTRAIPSQIIILNWSKWYFLHIYSPSILIELASRTNCRREFFNHRNSTSNYFVIKASSLIKVLHFTRLSLIRKMNMIVNRMTNAIRENCNSQAYRKKSNIRYVRATNAEVQESWAFDFFVVGFKCLGLDLCCYINGDNGQIDSNSKTLSHTRKQ